MFREETESGLAALHRVTRLLQSVRASHETEGVWEAADFNWWWRVRRASDAAPQIFLVGSDGDDFAAITHTAWHTSTAIDVAIHPDASNQTRRDVWHRALSLATGPESFETMIDVTDSVAMEHLTAAGFVDTLERGGSARITTDRLPEPQALPTGYRLVDRTTDTNSPHHMDVRIKHGIEKRLRQTPLYRSDLDITIVSDTGEVASYGIFWFDPATSTGFVEPMGTDEPHRRLGLARCVLATGLSRLRDLGASRIRINYEIDNKASSALYLGTGFVPVMTTAMWTREGADGNDSTPPPMASPV